MTIADTIVKENISSNDNNNGITHNA